MAQSIFCWFVVQTPAWEVDILMNYSSFLGLEIKVLDDQKIEHPLWVTTCQQIFSGPVLLGLVYQQKYLLLGIQGKTLALSMTTESRVPNCNLTITLIFLSPKFTP